MEEADLIIERRITETIRLPKGKKDLIEEYFQKSQYSTKSEIPSTLMTSLPKKEYDSFSKVQSIVLDIIKKTLSPKRKILINTIASNPGKNHADLLKIEAIIKAGYIKKTLSKDLKWLRMVKIIRDDVKNEKTHPKHVYMCNDFELLEKAFLNPR